MKFLFLSACLLFSLNLKARIVEKIQAEVGEEMFSLMDLKRFETQLRLNLLQPSPSLKSMFKKKELLKNKKKLLDFIVTRSMLFQIANKEALPPVSKKQVEKKVQELKKSSSHKSFSLKLKRAELTLKKLKKLIDIDLRIELLLNHKLFSKITISEQDIESYHFHKYNQALFKAFEYEFVSIQVSKNKKASLLKKLKQKSSSDLKAVALLLGLEIKSLRLQGKDIQPILKKQLDKLFVSQISPLFMLGGNYYVLQLKWKHPQIAPHEQKKKAEIEIFLFQKKVVEETKKWIEKEKSMFSIAQHSL